MKKKNPVPENKKQKAKNEKIIDVRDYESVKRWNLEQHEPLNKDKKCKAKNIFY